jgi:TRAP-type C4-dicarboxylate transport system permease small subunit
LQNRKKRLFNTLWIRDRGTGSIAFIGGIGIFVIATAIVVDVLMRWMFNAPILGVDDLSIYVLAVVVSSFFPAGLAEERFVTIRFLGKALGPRSSLWLEVFGALCTIAFFMLLAWKILLYSVDITRSGLATIVLQLPQAPWWWLVTVVIALCIPVQAIILVKKLISAVRGPVSAPESGNRPEADQIESEEHSAIET